MSFFPSEKYEIPVSGGSYMKFQDGANRFRVMSGAVIGWEYWTKDNKPVRSPAPFKGVPENARLEDGQFKPKHFWIFLAYDYKDEKVKVLEITQKSIMQQMKANIDDSAWGDPKGYDFVVRREGAGLDTEYTTSTQPPSPAPSVQIPEYDLNAIFTGGDVFAKADGPVDEAPENIDPESIGF